MAGSYRGGPAEGLRRQALLVAGSISLGLGVIGVFVPLLPTTPFLLLAAACYVRSSPRVYRWLMANRVLGTYIRSYRSGAGIPRRVKVASVCFLWLTIGYSAAFVVHSALVRVILVLIAIGVTAHVVSRRAAAR